VGARLGFRWRRRQPAGVYPDSGREWSRFGGVHSGGARGGRWRRRWRGFESRIRAGSLGSADETVGGGRDIVDAATGANTGSRAERSHAGKGQGESLYDDIV
ncbi:unnamed protein product, partial [Ectocarpus sp. 8 AP-2014]